MSESIPQFYKRIQRCDPQLSTTYSKEKPYFNVLSRQCNFGTVQFSYRDFYKVTLIMGVGKLYYAGRLCIGFYLKWLFRLTKVQLYCFR